MDSFDEAYARYLRFLALLDKTDDISEKNLLFRQLTQLLSELELRLKSHKEHAADRDACIDDREYTYWV